MLMPLLLFKIVKIKSQMVREHLGIFQYCISVFPPELGTKILRSLVLG